MLEQLLAKGMLMKRLFILVGIVAAMLLVVAPAFAPASAQSADPDATITGVIEAASPTALEGPTHTITEASTGDVYGLFSDAQGVDLSQYEGLSVTINGIFQTQGNPLSDFDDLTDVLIYVTSVEALDVGPGGEEVSAAGVLKAGLPADVLGDGTHSIVDEATGTLYALREAGVNLDAYVDQPVTVYGTLTPGEEIPGAGGIATSTLPSIDVTRVEPADAEKEPGQPTTEAPDNTPTGNLPDGTTSGSPSDQYGGTSGDTSDQYTDATDGGSIDSPSADAGSSADESSSGVLGLLPDTGGLAPLTLGLSALLLLGGGLLGYRFIRQS